MGDFFHNHDNPGEVVDSSIPVFQTLDSILAGNHDLLAVEGKISSLMLLDGMRRRLQGKGAKVVCGTLGKPYVEALLVAGNGPQYLDYACVSVPHVYTQELFEESLDKVLEWQKTKPAALRSYLFLHCNVDSGFAEGSDTALNLTLERARQLLDAGISRIFVGHDHTPRELLGGRLVVVGNTHPTSFADISDKRYITVDNNGVMTSHLCYEAARHYHSVDWQQALHLLQHPDEDLAEIHWLRLTGEAHASQVVALAGVVRELWKAHPNLFGLKSDVKIAELAGMTSDAEPVKLADLPTLVEAELASQPDLLALWREFSKEGEA